MKIKTVLLGATFVTSWAVRDVFFDKIISSNTNEYNVSHLLFLGQFFVIIFCLVMSGLNYIKSVDTPLPKAKLKWIVWVMLVISGIIAYISEGFSIKINGAVNHSIIDHTAYPIILGVIFFSYSRKVNIKLLFVGLMLSMFGIGYYNIYVNFRYLDFSNQSSGILLAIITSLCYAVSIFYVKKLVLDGWNVYNIGWIRALYLTIFLWFYFSIDLNCFLKLPSLDVIIFMFSTGIATVVSLKVLSGVNIATFGVIFALVPILIFVGTSIINGNVVSYLDIFFIFVIGLGVFYINKSF